MCVCVNSSLLQDTKEKIQKVKAYEERLMECLADILEKHIPHPQNGSSVNKKKKVHQAVLCPISCAYRSLFTWKIGSASAPAQLTVFCFIFRATPRSQMT